MNESPGTVDGRYVVQIDRRIDHPVDKLWSAVTEPDQLGRWYPLSVTEMEPRVGGRIAFDDGEGTLYRGEVKEFDPPRVFSFTEESDLVHIRLEPDGDGCRLTFTHTFDDPSIADSVETGWNRCLDALEELAGSAA